MTVRELINELEATKNPEADVIFFINAEVAIDDEFRTFSFSRKECFIKTLHPKNVRIEIP